MDQKEEWMVFKVKQSPEEKKVIELISFMVHKHYCANDIEAVIEYLDEDIVWIGAGDHEYAVGKEVIDIFESLQVRFQNVIFQRKSITC